MCPTLPLQAHPENVGRRCCWKSRVRFRSKRTYIIDRTISNWKKESKRKKKPNKQIIGLLKIVKLCFFVLKTKQRRVVVSGSVVGFSVFFCSDAPHSLLKIEKVGYFAIFSHQKKKNYNSIINITIIIIISSLQSFGRNWTM